MRKGETNAEFRMQNAELRKQRGGMLKSFSADLADNERKASAINGLHVLNGSGQAPDKRWTAVGQETFVPTAGEEEHGAGTLDKREGVLQEIWDKAGGDDRVPDSGGEPGRDLAAGYECGLAGG